MVITEFTNVFPEEWEEEYCFSSVFSVSGQSLTLSLLMSCMSYL